MQQNPVSVDKNWETKSRKAQAVIIIIIVVIILFLVLFHYVVLFK